jgi:hypothetical protein
MCDLQARSGTNRPLMLVVVVHEAETQAILRKAVIMYFYTGRVSLRTYDRPSYNFFLVTLYSIRHLLPTHKDEDCSVPPGRFRGGHTDRYSSTGEPPSISSSNMARSALQSIRPRHRVIVWLQNRLRWRQLAGRG